jgi:hypothetical protein
MVSSGALDNVTSYTLPGDPYGHLVRSGDPGARAITPQQAAAEIVDAAELDQMPLRVPIGEAARALLAARRAAPDDAPFVPGQPAPVAGGRS